MKDAGLSRERPVTVAGRFAAALRFLTVIPLPTRLGTSEEELTGATLFFPLVGLLIGGLTLVIVWGLGLLLPPMVTAVLAVGVLLSFSGGLHLDGLADSADGFFSSRPREQILEIMRDSATGVMGATAIFLLLLLKFSCLISLDDNLLPVILLMPIGGRTALLLMMAMLPYARSGGGLATLFYTSRSRLTALWGLLLFVVAAWFFGGGRGVAAVVAVILVALLFSWFCRVKIGGATGDTLGATCELAETVVALVFVVGIEITP